MAAEVKKEIQLEVAHVLFIDSVGTPSFRLTNSARPSNLKALYSGEPAL
jgi:hypothetical protein